MLALLYANERSRAEGLPTCYVVGPAPPEWLGLRFDAEMVSGCLGYRLLTADEWVVAAYEVGARAFGRDRREGAWLPGCSRTDGCLPRPVGQPAVLHDFLGNVNELVWYTDEAGRWAGRWDPRGGGLVMPFVAANIYRTSAYAYGSDEGLRLARTVRCGPKP